MPTTSEIYPGMATTEKPAFDGREQGYCAYLRGVISDILTIVETFNVGPQRAGDDVLHLPESLVITNS